MDINQNNGDEVEAFALNKWQRCLFSLNAAESLPRHRADAVRGILNQLHVASVCDNLPGDVMAGLKNHYTSLYSAIIDCSNPETGLNNYAEGALTLSSNCANESSEWKSSLTKDSIQDIDGVKELLNESKRYSENTKENLREAAQSLQRATHQPPPKVNSSNWQQKIAPPSNHGLPNNNVNNIRASGNLQSHSGHVPSAFGGSVQGTPPVSNTFPSTAEPRHQNPLFAGSRDIQQGSNRPPHLPGLNYQRPSSGGGNMPPSHQRPSSGGCNMPPSHQNTAPLQKGYVPVGGNRVGPSPGSMGYDPASQMCNLGILGIGDTAGNAGQPSLKRKFGTSDTRQDSRPGHYQSFQGDQTGPGRSFYNRGGPGPGPRPRQPEDDEDEGGGGGGGAFRSARDQLSINNQKKFGNRGGSSAGPSSSGYGNNRKVLGVARRGLKSKFVPPVLNKEESDDHMGGYKPPNRSGGDNRASSSGGGNQQEPTDERLKNIDPKMIELIMSEIMDHGPPIQWDDIAGLEFAKSTIKEIVVWPMLRPDIFTGLRGPPKGLLLFGPPGTGKTLIGKCIACQSGATFFSISASSLTSKWVGEGEKMVRALFSIARCYQPAVIFIDEIDSLLSQRSNDEHESSRRIKTEFLVQLDGATTSSDERLLIVGATNRPHEIDEAARRRLVKRLYIPLPDPPARKQIVSRLLSQQGHSLSEQELDDICEKSKGYSGADMANLCRESALGPIRSIQGMDIQHISAEQVRPIVHGDLVDALQNVRPSVAQSDLDTYLEWNAKFGCGSAK